MCGRFTRTMSWREIYELYRLTVERETDFKREHFKPRYNVAPTQDIPILRQPDGEPEMTIAHWGLVPPWAKDEKIAYKMINARAETIKEKASFKTAVNKHRCLIPADGFYEWKMMSDGSKQPHWFHMEDKRPFSFAGTWEHNGQLDVTSCAIVTTQANGVVKPYHNRMPVILAEWDYDLWISGNTALNDALALLRPYDGNDLAVYAVSKAVNSVKNDTPDCIAKAA